ncbi:MAG TPA: hypothetical protein PLN48_16780 [Lachnospiraceae bacterium]|nr:hypothetical protein [Lachnospiraceae bacterium]
MTKNVPAAENSCIENKRMVQERADRMQAEESVHSVRTPAAGAVKARHFVKDTGRNLSRQMNIKRAEHDSCRRSRKEEDQKDIIN